MSTPTDEPTDAGLVASALSALAIELRARAETDPLGEILRRRAERCELLSQRALDGDLVYEPRMVGRVYIQGTRDLTINVWPPTRRAWDVAKRAHEAARLAAGRTVQFHRDVEEEPAGSLAGFIYGGDTARAMEAALQVLRAEPGLEIRSVEDRPELDPEQA
jgi:hypothetical protein